MAGTEHAPELTPNSGWLNTAHPLRFSEELRGQVVVLDFWTFCCINCIHILPDLKYLEGKFRTDPVTFIGVHSAKFSNEASRDPIRSAVLRYEISHPVVIDQDMAIWRAYAARSWPTLIVVDAEGYIVGRLAGEGNRSELEGLIESALAMGRTQQNLAKAPLALEPEKDVVAPSGLAFPGKVVADETRLFVSDTNHNRIIVAERPASDGKARVLQTVGSGAIGSADGAASEASFDHPQGLALGRDILYVADTENHLIRAVNLQTFDVSTVVGTGEMTNDRSGGGMGRAQGINSPWDLVMEGSTLYVAMAGTHQIWRMDMPVGFARAFAGTGRENIVDGPCETAAFAQPSGICLHQGGVYVADSEVSAIRGIDMAEERVFTVLGEGLFSFGDEDGTFPNAKLQHPLGIASWQSQLVVADSYNHKIKAVQPSDRSARTLHGNGRPGSADENGGPAFSEPGGICVVGDTLYVADTNNHRILEINLGNGDWKEVVFEGLSSLRSESDIDLNDVEAIAIDPSAQLSLTFQLELPEGAHLNMEAPWSVTVSQGDRRIMQHTDYGNGMKVVVQPSDATADLEVRAGFTYCLSSGACVPLDCGWRIPIRAANGAGNSSLLLKGSANSGP